MWIALLLSNSLLVCKFQNFFWKLHPLSCKLTNSLPPYLKRCLLDNNRSCAYMMIYWGKRVNVPIRWMCVYGGMRLHGRMGRVWCYPLSMLGTCVGFFAMTVQLTRVRTDVFCRLSFDWRTKALVSNEHHDCSAFHDTIPAMAFRQACRQHVSDQLLVHIRFPYNVS